MNTGGCFCGAVRFEVSAPLTSVTYCHCSKCRKWHGHFGAWCAVDREGFRVSEARGLKWHEVSPTVRRGFCLECGSSLLFDESPESKIGIAAGTLDEPTGIREKNHIYAASKGDYYDLCGELPRYDTFPNKPRDPDK
jgi:hypothetical protein